MCLWGNYYNEAVLVFKLQLFSNLFLITNPGINIKVQSDFFQRSVNLSMSCLWKLILKNEYFNLACFS